MTKQIEKNTVIHANAECRKMLDGQPTSIIGDLDWAGCWPVVSDGTIVDIVDSEDLTQDESEYIHNAENDWYEYRDCNRPVIRDDEYGLQYA